MAVMVALLRGVNVGGTGTLPMASLRAVAVASGLDHVRTYIQSGNLVFSTASGSTERVACALREAIAETTRLDPEVIVRTRAELASVVDASPFLARPVEPAHLHVTFLGADAASHLIGFDRPSYLPEEVAAVGRELHLFLPTGVGRSKLATEVARRTGRVGTMRSWRTVTKLLELANEID